MYAARAAGVLDAIDDLKTLALDPNDNVREAALVVADRSEAAGGGDGGDRVAARDPITS